MHYLLPEARQQSHLPPKLGGLSPLAIQLRPNAAGPLSPEPPLHEPWPVSSVCVKVARLYPTF